MKRYVCLFSSLLFCISIKADLLSFTDSGLTGWKGKSFAGYTEYQLINDADNKVVHAISNSSASGLFNKQEVDLKKTPLLSWRWKVSQIGRGNDEKTKPGDDYPVRIYVIVKGEPYFWSNSVLEYVWSNSAVLESKWKNPFSSQFRHIAVETGEEHIGKWRGYSRNVESDFNRVFGFKPKIVDAVAIMTDSDNSKQKFEAWYGDIEFIKGEINDWKSQSNCFY